MKLRTKLLAVVLVLFGCFLLAQDWQKHGLILDSAERCGSVLFSVLFIIGGVGILLRKRWGWHIAHSLLGLGAIVMLWLGVPGCLFGYYFSWVDHRPESPLLSLAAGFATIAVLCVTGLVLLRSDKPAGWSRQETLEER